MEQNPVLKEATRTGTLFWAGVIVGLLLSVIGPLSGSYMGAVPARLLFCTGLGIILGAFGSTATIKQKGIVISGGAAIAIALLFAGERVLRDSFATIEIGGDVVGASLHFDGERSYGMEDGRRRRQEFVFLGPEIKRDFVSLDATVSINGEESELIFECIPKQEIEAHFGSGRIVQWRLDANGGVLTRNGRTIASNGEPCGGQASGNRSDRPWWRPWSVRVAFAAQPGAMTRLIVDLESNSTAIRRAARKGLAEPGVENVALLLRQLAVTPISYRTRLGIIVALTDIMRANANKDQLARIRRSVSTDDLGRLTAATADRDRTIRIYASEFLYDLGDPRVIEPAFSGITKADENGRYNLILVIGGARPALTPAQRVPVDRKLRDLSRSAGPRTRELIAGVIAGEPLRKPS